MVAMTSPETEIEGIFVDDLPVPQPIVPTAVYTPDQVAQILTCSRAHVYRLMRSGRLEFIDLSAKENAAGKARIFGQNLLNFIEDSTVSYQ